jgi:hypothetical protein
MEYSRLKVNTSQATTINKYNNLTIIPDDLKMTHCESKHVGIRNLSVYIHIYIFATDWHLLSFVFSIIIRNKMEYSRLMTRLSGKIRNGLRNFCTIYRATNDIHCTSGRLVARATTFCKVEPSIFSKIIAAFSITHKSVHQFTCTEQKAPDNNEVHTSLQKCWLAAWNWLHIIILKPTTSK